MIKEHFYNLTVTWTGNTGNGTSDYRAYKRDILISAENKTDDILASSDPAFRGDKTRYNSEELLLAALSSCHMLWFLHLCAKEGIIVTDYVDRPSGIMIVKENGSGKFKEVTLNPIITVSTSVTVEKIEELHKKSHELCFIANSVNFPVHHKFSIIENKFSRV